MEIKEGNIVNRNLTFKCNNCGAFFEVVNTEYAIENDSNVIIVKWYSACSCPCCSKNVS